VVESLAGGWNVVSVQFERRSPCDKGCTDIVGTGKYRTVLNLIFRAGACEQHKKGD
jgi:hypothetical protein